jgi:hypothetical protein
MRRQQLLPLPLRAPTELSRSGHSWPMSKLIVASVQVVVVATCSIKFECDPSLLPWRPVGPPGPRRMAPITWDPRTSSQWRPKRAGEGATRHRRPGPERCSLIAPIPYCRALEDIGNVGGVTTRSQAKVRRRQRSQQWARRGQWPGDSGGACTPCLQLLKGQARFKHTHTTI